MNEINYFEDIENLEPFDVRAMRAVKRQVNERLQVKPGEHVLILADFATEKEMIHAFATAVSEADAIPTIMIMPNSGWDPLASEINSDCSRCNFKRDSGRHYPLRAVLRFAVGKNDGPPTQATTHEGFPADAGLGTDMEVSRRF